MCGIIGYIGNNSAAPILLDGLRRLEYRGYDSAGVAVLSPNGQIQTRKRIGRISNLADLLPLLNKVATQTQRPHYQPRRTPPPIACRGRNRHFPHALGHPRRRYR